MTQMNHPSPQVLQVFTLLQIASEALYGLEPEARAAAVGGMRSSVWTLEMLKLGEQP